MKHVPCLNDCYWWTSPSCLAHGLSGPFRQFYFMTSKRPTHSSVRQFAFTMNKILFKVFGAMSKDSYSTVIVTSVSVSILRTRLFVNVMTSSLINSVHQIIIYYVVRYMAGSDWCEFGIDFSFPQYIVRLVCSFILFNLLYSLLPHVWWNKFVYFSCSSLYSHSLTLAGAKNNVLGLVTEDGGRQH